MGGKQDAPQLVLHGHNYEMVKPKVKNWYDFAKFEDSIEDLSVAEYIHGTAECIASMYEGVTAEDVIDGLDLEDLKILFAKLYAAMVGISNKALSEPKNGEKATD